MSAVAQPKESSSAASGAALTALERYGGRRGRQAVAAFAAAQLAAPVVKAAWTKARSREDFTITVAGADDIYPDLHDWVLARMPEGDRKALIVSTVTTRVGDSSPYDAVEGATVQQAEVRLRYDGSRRQTVRIDGHKVHVSVEREDIPGRANLPDNWRQIMEKITFVASNAAGRDAVVRMIEGLLADKHLGDRQPALYMPSRYGGAWNRRGDLPARTLESVVLKDGQLERLVGDLQTFLANEDWYTRMSQPWHRGYLFHGSPGTGKTSIARALANHFGLPTYYLPLGDMDRDADLMACVGRIEPRSVLLIEDCDVFHGTTARDDENDQVSLAAMLNALDGVFTPHGLITILTTNDRDKLDEALTRKGRIDVDEEFTALDFSQARNLAETFEGPGPDLDVERFIGKSPADLIAELHRRKLGSV